jgi:hypothetical protein
MLSSSEDVIGTPEQMFYWVPGEIVVIVRLPRRPADEILEVLAEQVRGQLNSLLAPHDLALEAYGSAGRWLDTAMPPVRRRTFIFGLHRQQPLAAIFFHTRHADPEVEDPAPIALSYIQVQLERLAQEGLSIVSAMPNWLVTAAPMLYAEGGPALPPRLAPETLPPTDGNSVTGWRTSFVDQAIRLDSRGAQDVVVAVLDTAPHPDLLAAALLRPRLHRNWLLQRLTANLRSANGSFEIEYDRYPTADHVRTGRNAQSEAAYYPMPDHGLFVAGLLRDLAARAQIRLVRILNDFGGGDLYNLFAALTDLEQELVAGAIRRLVVNLSLTVMPDPRRLPYIWFHSRGWQSAQLAGAVHILGHIEEGLRLLFESLHAQGALIVAAAGNDSLFAQREGKQARQPRAPARYETTLGVAAVNSRFVPAAFANAASQPALVTGVASLGGDMYEALDVHGLPEAVRGVYISPGFPGGEPNTSGWADWCGSSFAAPIISALGAHLFAQGWSNQQAMARIVFHQGRGSSQLFGSRPDAPALLANVVRVQQQFFT